jgi:hypothetical protein
MKKVFVILILNFSIIFAATWKEACERYSEPLQKCINDWKKIGIKSPDEAVKWDKAGVFMDEVYKLKTKYHISAEDYKIWKSINALSVYYDFGDSVEINDGGIELFYKLGIKNPKEAKQWDDLLKDIPMSDFDSSYLNYLKYWKQLGIKTPKDLKKWKDKGLFKYVKFDKVKEWMKVNVKSVSEMKKWVDLYLYNPDKISKWKAIGIKTPEEVEKWKNAGVVYTDDVIEWRKVGVKTPKEVKEWKAIGIKTPEEVEKWKNAGIKTVKEAKRWKTVVSNPDKISKWQEIGIKTPEEIKKWYKIGIYFPEDAFLLMKLHFSPDNLNSKKAKELLNSFSDLLYLDNDKEFKEAYLKLKNHGCFTNKNCKALLVKNKAVVKNHKLLVTIVQNKGMLGLLTVLLSDGNDDSDDKNFILIEFPLKEKKYFGLVSVPKVPKIYTNINNKDKEFVVIYKPTNTTDRVEMSDGNKYDIEVYKAIYWSKPD